MVEAYENQVRALSTAKALAVAAYGESVAAYRYRTLSEKTTSPVHQKLFGEMADEEQGHHQRLQILIRKYFPDSDFVLRAEDKELVIVGHRMQDVTDRASFDRALDQIGDSERLTGGFYETLLAVTTRKELHPFLKEMAEECLGHAARLAGIPPMG